MKGIRCVKLSDSERDRVFNSPYRAEYKLILKHGWEAEKLLRFLSNGMLCVELNALNAVGTATFELVKEVNSDGVITACPEYYTISLHSGGKEIGKASYSFENQGDSQSIRLHGLQVLDENLVNKGIGSLMLQKIEGAGQKLGIEKIEAVFAPSGIGNAKAFYEHHGYQFTNDPFDRKIYIAKNLKEAQAE